MVTRVTLIVGPQSHPKIPYTALLPNIAVVTIIIIAIIIANIAIIVKEVGHLSQDLEAMNLLTPW